jgi:23S rRNA (uridine2552-2'-O)-methyltransferase
MKRNKTSKAWLHRHLTDPYVRQARDEGYRSRAAFKLLEIVGRDHLLKPGMTVVDLGAAPGGWSQAAAASLGVTGRVIAVDLIEMAPIAGVTFIQGDFRAPAVRAELETRLASGRPDLVLSDMSPNLTGVAVTDQTRGIALAEAALQFACAGPSGPCKHVSPRLRGTVRAKCMCWDCGRSPSRKWHRNRLPRREPAVTAPDNGFRIVGSILSSISFEE